MLREETLQLLRKHHIDLARTIALPLLPQGKGSAWFLVEQRFRPIQAPHLLQMAGLERKWSVGYENVQHQVYSHWR